MIEVEVVGNGHYAGAKSNISEYSVSEESTAIDASDTSGGTGQITFTANDDPSRLGSIMLQGDTVRLTDGDRGMTEGKVTSLAGNNGEVQVTASSLLGQLVVNKTALGKQDTLANVLRYYIEDLGGIPWSRVAIDASLSTIPVRAIGWTGDLWKKIGELLVTVGAEISLVRSNVVIRKIRERRALEINNVREGWSVAAVDMARQVEVFYYNTERKIDQLIYPAGGWNENITAYTVDTGQVSKVNIPINVYLDDIPIAQPTCVNFVSRDYSASSVYTVSDINGKVVSPSNWLDNGGGVYVSRGADGKSIDLTIVGASGNASLAPPFRIGIVNNQFDSTKTYYSSLRIIGTGVHFNRQSVIVPTGVAETDIVRDVGVSVDNAFIVTESQAREIAATVASFWAAPKRKLSISKADINRPASENPDFDYAKFSDFDAYAAANSISTFANFDTAWLGKTFDEFDDYWYQQVADDFLFQVFGNANGARVQWRRAMYRIRSATTTPDGVDYEAEADTTFGDFDDSAGATMTFAEFDALYAGMTDNDFALIPLPKVKPEYDS